MAENNKNKKRKRIVAGAVRKLVDNFVKFINISWKVDTSTTLIHFPIREVRYKKDTVKT